MKNAQECGARGAILYNDPADYAKEGQDKVYPQYIWLPRTGVQRGSIRKGRGDALTPGLPSVDGVIRIPEDKAGLPEIPATPMPYGDAVELMKIMKGLIRFHVISSCLFISKLDPAAEKFPLNFTLTRVNLTCFQLSNYTRNFDTHKNHDQPTI